MHNPLVIALFYFIVSAFAQNTPVIGGSCKTGTPDVQIGAKQTQFFLKCEANDDSQDGNGIWVVKSRAAAAPGSNENQNAQQHPQKMRKVQMSNVCEQDSTAREGQACTTSETCLQQNYEQAGSYLQCDSTSQRWIKRSCQQDFVFSFEHQSCIGHTKTIRHVARQAASGGVICTYTQCNNNNNQCSIGTCNNGYCCSSAPIAPIQVSQSCPSCRVPQIIQIRCPGGGMPYGTCNSGYCSAGYQCIQSTNMCCASVRQISTSCPGNRVAVGSCMNGRCGSGYSCNVQSNSCCPDPTICPDGTQAAGACVNNLCGTGFTCTNNLCCSSASTTPRCLDGSSAVGACISGRCGSGFTCTTGNICCPSTLTVCPVGQTSIGVCVNGICPAGYTCINNNCCGAANTITCDAADASGPCVDGLCPDGYLCDNDATDPQCCPNVDFNDSIGPCIDNACPAGFLCVISRDACFQRLDGGGDPTAAGPCIDGLCPTGFTCVNLQCIPTTG